MPEATQDEIDAGEKILPVVVRAKLPGYPSGERVLLLVELRPCGRHCIQEIGPIEALRPSELAVGGVQPTNPENVVQQGGHHRPLRIVRYAKRANLLAYAFQD